MNWSELKAKVAKHGLRDALLVVPMPTASTAQILGTRVLEPGARNLYVRRVLSGEFVQVNKHLLRGRIQRNLWADDLRTQFIAHK
jgi:ribonucleotide reductase alpha subunit